MATIPEAAGLLDEYHGHSPWTAAAIGVVLYVGCLVGALALLPPGLPVGPERPLLATFGVIGTWRWSWAAFHLVRSLVWRRLAFPRLRRRADAAPKPDSLAVLVTSYRMPTELNTVVYRELFAEIARFGVPTTVMACITDPSDISLLEWLFQAQPGLPPGTTLHCLPQDGTGKRSAMAAGLHQLAWLGLSGRALLTLMDGDTILTPGCLAKTCAVVMAQPDVGAVTTDNIALVKGHSLTREWYRLRLTHRDSLMCSMSLSRRVLVLTGRFSVFRAELALTAEFIGAIAADAIQHRRLGEIRMVTGDDKSTWFSLLRHGWKMLYVPDVAVYNVEELPGRSFVGSSINLMLRWYGNMARNNGRAIRLGPGRIGWFTWICLVDQRISPWTSLVGLTTMAFSCSFGTINPFFYYVAWVLLTRLLVSMIYLATTGRFHPLFPLILYFHQIAGAWIKIYMFFHPDRQGWSRQKVGAGKRMGRGSRLVSDIQMTVSVGLFMVAVGALAGLIAPPSHRPAQAGITALVQGASPSHTPNWRNSIN